MKRTLALLTVAGLLITAHRLPAPIQEIPESPTPAPERPAKAKRKPNSKPAREATTAHKSDVAGTANVPSNSNVQATVFIYRPAGFPWGMYNTTAITMDGVETRTMADARYSVRKLNPGRHTFEAKGGVITNQRVPVEIDLKPGQNYYLRVRIDAMGFPEGKIIFTQVPAAQGAQETAKLTQGP